MQKITLNPDDIGNRLDLVLAFHLKAYSRSGVRKLLDAGRVYLNGDIEYRPNYRISAEDKIEVESEAALERKQLPAYDYPLEILHLDPDLVIGYKPTGIAVHPASSTDTETYLNALYSNVPEVSEYGITLVNRIDKDTSGIVVAARSSQGAWWYARAFAEGRVKKYYLAVVYGNWGSKHGMGTVDSSVKIMRDKNLKRQVVDRERGTFASDKFTALAYNFKKNWTYLLVQPVTGRTHQIRVHLSHMGFPIVGDSLYDGQEHKRLLLHAYKVVLPTFDESELTVATDYPKDFPKEFKDAPIKIR